jgi:hypothetical protein
MPGQLPTGRANILLPHQALQKPIGTLNFGNKKSKRGKGRKGIVPGLISNHVMSRAGATLKRKIFPLLKTRLSIEHVDDMTIFVIRNERKR